MAAHPDTTNAPPLEEQEKKKQATSSGKKARPQDNASETLVIVQVGNKLELFDLALARRREAERRLKMLGAFAHNDFDKQQLRAFAQGRYVPERALTTWKQNYLLHGFDGLLPQDWVPLQEKAQEKVLERLEMLGNLTDAITITGDDVHELAKRRGWHHRKAERLVCRYQIDGVWGLAPERDPERIHRPRNQVPPRDYASASPDAKAKADERLALITPYIGRRRIPNDDLKTHAKKHKTSLRTLRGYLAKHRKWGLDGLLPKEERSDKGHPHNTSPLMEDIIGAIWFSHMDIPLHEVHAQACQRARLLGEPEPTLWQVRFVCDRIPEEVKLVADKRFGEFRSKRRLTYRFQFDGSVIIYQIDFTKVDVLVRDIRRSGYRSPSKEIRPYLITCMECSSRLVLSWLLTYDVPNSNNIAAVIRDALIVTDEKPYGGIPHAIWVDGGKQLVSHHIQRIASDLHFELKEGKPNFPEDRGDPQERGIEERFFGTLKTGLWCTLRGYVDSNTKERNPNAKGELTITELAAKVQEFIDKYHREEHSEMGMTPLEFWAKHCHATGADPRDLDVLLLAARARIVDKGNIHYGKRRYWHDDMAEIPSGTEVEIRAQPDYMRPDEIEVFHNGRHICTASAHDSAKGRAVTGKRVLAAQRHQRRRINETIKKKKAVLHNADLQIKAQSMLVQQQLLDEQGTVPNQKPQEQLHETLTGQSTQVASSPTHSKKRALFGSSPSTKQRNTAWDKALADRKRQEERSKR